MEKLSVKEIINSTNSKLIFGNPNDIVSSFSTDTRTLKRFEHFIALKGERYDGHDFIHQAISAGARGIVISHFTEVLNRLYVNLPNIILTSNTLDFLIKLAKYYRQTKISPTVISISGSNGKTTTKDILYSILSKHTSVIANKKSFNNLIGLPLTVLETNSYHKYCILEHGISQPGEMDKLLEISRPHIAVITNIGRTHLEFLGDINSVLVEETKPIYSLPDNGIAVINVDDILLKDFVKKNRYAYVTYGIDNKADVMAKDVIRYPGKTKFELVIDRDNKRHTAVILMPTTGRFNVYNALSAAAAAYAVGADIATIKDGIESFVPQPMRMEHIYLSSGAILINDAYNANPDSMREAIKNFVETYRDYERIVVLGDMLELGDKSVEFHKEIGGFVSTLDLKFVLLIGDNMNFAYEEFVAKGKNNAKYFTDYESVIIELKKMLTHGVACLFKASRKMELERIIKALT